MKAINSVKTFQSTLATVITTAKKQREMFHVLLVSAIAQANKDNLDWLTMLFTAIREEQLQSSVNVARMVAWVQALGITVELTDDTLKVSWLDRDLLNSDNFTAMKADPYYQFGGIDEDAAFKAPKLNIEQVAKVAARGLEIGSITEQDVDSFVKSLKKEILEQKETARRWADKHRDQYAAMMNKSNETESVKEAA